VSNKRGLFSELERYVSTVFYGGGYESIVLEIRKWGLNERQLRKDGLEAVLIGVGKKKKSLRGTLRLAQKGGEAREQYSRISWKALRTRTAFRCWGRGDGWLL